MTGHRTYTVNMQRDIFCEQNNASEKFYSGPTTLRCPHSLRFSRGPMLMIVTARSLVVSLALISPINERARLKYKLHHRHIINGQIIESFIDAIIHY